MYEKLNRKRIMVGVMTQVNRWVWTPLSDKIWNRVKEPAWEQIFRLVRDQVDDRLKIRDQVVDQTRFRFEDGEYVTKSE